MNDGDAEDGGLVQGIFDFESGNADGFENWRREQEARLDAVRREWAVPVGRKVRIRLRNIDDHFIGKLMLAMQPPAIDRRQPLHLRIDRVDFLATEIDECIVVE